MNDFEQSVYDDVRAALATIDPSIIPTIYALSFFISDDGDPRCRMLELSYNTREQVERSMPCASDADEATWNYAFWLHTELGFIGAPETESARLLETLLKSRGLWYSDEEEDADFDRCDRIGSAIDACFTDACVQVAQALHDNGIIKRQFGRPIPILVHGLEYYDKIAAQTRAANPPGLAQAFEDWVAGPN
jgi:hypothetical protein